MACVLKFDRLSFIRLPSIDLKGVNKFDWSHNRGQKKVPSRKIGMTQQHNHEKTLTKLFIID